MGRYRRNHPCVNNCKFINVEHGVQLRGGHQGQVFNNTFRYNNNFVEVDNKLLLELEGVYTKLHGGYLVSDNEFYDSLGILDAYGLVSRSSGENGGLVHQNYFEGNAYGLQTEWDNSELTITCNKFRNNKSIKGGGADMALNPNWARYTQSPYYGNCQDQASNGDPHNKFLGGSNMHILKGAEDAKVTDYHRTNYPVSPQNPNPPSLIDPPHQINLCETDHLIPCKDTLTKIPRDFDPTFEETLEEVDSFESEVNLVKDTLFYNVPPSFADTIISEEVDVEDKIVMLEAVSPYLPDTILKLTILEATDIPENDLESILIANSALNPEVLELLDEREPELAESTIESVMDHQEGVSPRRPYEQRIKELTAKEQRVKNEYLGYISHSRLNDTTFENEGGGNYYDSMVDFLGHDSSFRTRTMLITSLVKHDRLNEADNYLAELQGSSHPEWPDYEDYISVLKKLKQQGRNIYQLTDAEKSSLFRVAKEDHKTGFHARSILNRVTDSIWQYAPFKFDNPESQEKRHVPIQETIKNGEANYFIAYPNPARDRVNIRFALPEAFSKDSEFIMKNSQGQNIKTYATNHSEGEFMWATFDLSNGIYFITLYQDQEQLETQKVLIAK